MTHLGLMSRARELLARRVAGSALVIVPLAMAAPAHADTTFLGGQNTISHISGGSFGHVSSTPSGQNIELTGDTLVGPNTNLNAFMVAQNLGHIDFSWSGTFQPGGSILDRMDNLVLATDITSKLSPTLTPETVTWTLDAEILDASNKVLVDKSVSSPTDKTFTKHFQRGVPASWTVTLDVTWTFPPNIDLVEQKETLDFAPQIGMSISTPTGGTDPSTPLPASMWSGGSLLAILAGAAFRRSRARRLA